MKDEITDKRKKVIADLILRSDFYIPMKCKEIAILLDIPKEQRNELQDILNDLVKDGVIGVSKAGKYGKPDNTAVTGKFISNRRGFGFVEVEGRENDIFIPEKNIGGAFHGDKVRVTITKEAKKGKRTEGKIISVLEHGIKQLVGTFEKNKSFGFVIPDNTSIGMDIFIPAGSDAHAENEDKVVVELVNYGAGNRNPEGRIVENLGNIHTPGTDITALLRAYNIPADFPGEVKEQVAKEIPDHVKKGQLKGRRDFRNLKIVTVDGDNTKDFDDAISLSFEDAVYSLGVHIADVTQYVTEKSPLDKQAYKRGTSVYLPDRVVPMLPYELSNGICSLNEGQDRLTLSCLMKFDEKGKLIDHEICESVINVSHRMTYNQIQAIYDGDKDLLSQYEDCEELITLSEKLSKILFKRRMKRGSIEFNFPESKILLNEDGTVRDICLRHRNEATQMIEEFMLAANETVAEDFYWRQIPFLYRTHGEPDSDKIDELKRLTGNFGYALKPSHESIQPMDIQKLLKFFEEKEENPLISEMTLRSMKRAEYGPKCIGHFGLAAKYYCHFTSPIRRYPDLQIHRIIKETLHGKMTDKRSLHFEKLMPEAGRHCSETERKADELEREGKKLKCCEYMEGHLGEEFTGRISGITSWGIYVELENSIEGMVSVTSLKGYYTYDERHYQMVSEVGNRSYHFGQEVRVKVVNSDPVMRTIDFEMADQMKGTKKHGRKENTK